MKVSDDFVVGARSSSHDSPGPDSESGSGAVGSGTAASHADEAEGPATSGSSSGLIDILFRFVEEIVGSADALIEVYADRAKLSMRRALVQAALAAGVAVCATIWLGAATLAIVRGLCGGFTTLWEGREWLGDLSGGLLALVLAAGAIALHLRMSSRRDLRRLKAKYERIGHERSQNHDAPSPASDG